MKIIDSGLTTENHLFSWGVVKAYLRVRGNEDEDSIMQQLRAATLQIERRTNLVLVRRSFTVFFDDKDGLSRKPYYQSIPLSPVDTSVAPTLEYFSGISGNAEQWTAYADFYLQDDTFPKLRFTDEAETPDFAEDRERWKLSGLIVGDASPPDALKIAVLEQLNATFNSMVDSDRVINNLVAPFAIHGNSI